MTFSQLPAFLSASFDHLSPPSTHARRHACSNSWAAPFSPADDAPLPPGSVLPASPPTSDPPTKPSGPPDAGPNVLAVHLLLAVLKPLMRHWPGDHLLFALDDTPTPATDPRCRARASTTTRRRGRPARSSSTATSGSHWPGWSITPPGTHWPCHCVLCSTSAPKTCPRWPSVTRGPFAPSWNWPSNWCVGCAFGWAAWASNCVWSSMAATPSVPSSSRCWPWGWWCSAVCARMPTCARCRRRHVDPVRGGRCRVTARSGSTWPSVPGTSGAGGGSAACNTASWWSRPSRTSRRPGVRPAAASAW